jgi:hypothetical protein
MRSRWRDAADRIEQARELEFHGWKQVHYAIDREDWPPQRIAIAKIRRVG